MSLDRPSIEVLGALTRLQANSDWSVVRGWLSACRQEALETCGMETDGPLLRAQGSQQTLQSLLDLAEQASSAFDRARQAAFKERQRKAETSGGPSGHPQMARQAHAPRP